MNLYDYLILGTIVGLLLIPPILSAIRHDRRRRLFQSLAEEYGLRVAVDQVPFWRFSWGAETVYLQQLSGCLAGKKVELTDALDPAYTPGFLGFRYFFYLEPSWVESTRLTVDGAEVSIGKWHGLATGRAIRAALDRF